MKFPFAAQSANDPDNRAANSARLINCYMEPTSETGVYVKSHLGTEAFAQLPGSFMRAMETVQGELYAAHGGGLYNISESGVHTLLGEIDDSPDTTISGNNGQVAVTAGGKYYVWNGSTLNQPSAGAFTGFGSSTFFEQRTFLTELGGRRVQWSDLLQPADLGGLDFATAEINDDESVRVIAFSGNLWVFKEGSIEIWASRDGGYASLPGSTIDTGLRSQNLITRIPNGAFFIGDDGTAYIIGGGLRRVSTVAVETSIKAENPDGCFYFEDEGHKFCVIHFPNRPAWVFDIGTNMWSERAEGNNLGAWGAKVCAQAYGSFFVGTDAGGVHKLTRNNADVSGELIRRMVSRTLDNDGKRFKVKDLEFRAKTGIYDDPQVILRVSKDGGLSWPIVRQQGLGIKGDTDKRVRFLSLGQYWRATFELTISDPVDVTISGAAFV